MCRQNGNKQFVSIIFCALLAFTIILVNSQACSMKIYTVMESLTDIIFQDSDRIDIFQGFSKLKPTSPGLTMPVTTTTIRNPDKCEVLCVALDFCSHLFKLLKEPTAKNLQILKNASCGFTAEGDPLVMCDDFLCGMRSGNPQLSNTKNISITIGITGPELELEFPEPKSSNPSSMASSRLENNLLRIRSLDPLNNEDCGTAFPSRINDGESAARGEFPWIVGIALHSSSGPQVICGGALVADDWVLTAAHCVTDSGHHIRNISHVRVGAFDIADKNEEGAQNIEVSEVLFHDKFRERPIVKHDIALLKLKRKVTPGANVGPICLPNSTSEEIYYNTKSTTTIAGWGGDVAQTGYSILQKVDIPIVPGEQCKRLFYGVRVRVLPDLQVCAGANGKDSCKGDSGGPLMTIINGRTVLVGIISFGTVQCDGRLPGVYTKVTSYMDWIRDTVIKNV